MPRVCFVVVSSRIFSVHVFVLIRILIEILTSELGFKDFKI